MVNDGKGRKAGYSISIKPPDDVREALRRSADAAGRTLTKEIELRLASALGEGEPELDRILFGWTDQPLKRNRALGRCAGALAYRQERLAGEASPVVLAMLKVAMNAFLERLGADESALTENHRALANATGEQLYNDLLQARESSGAVRDLVADSAAFAAIAEDLDMYRPKAKHSFSALGRQARKKGGP